MQSLTAPSAIFGAELCIVSPRATCLDVASKPCTRTARERSGSVCQMVWGDGRLALQNSSRFGKIPLASQASLRTRKGSSCSAVTPEYGGLSMEEVNHICHMGTDNACQ